MDFLERVAKKIFEDHRGEMQKQRIVLPSRRAALYLARYLARQASAPQWSPVMMTVSDLFHSLSSYRSITGEEEIFELYSVYRSLYGTEMSFDDFWSWGEVIVSDFNDIDLYLADATKLYSNISDLKEIDERFGGLTPEQVEIIRGFWKSFDPGNTESTARNGFVSVWRKLGPLYEGFRTSLEKKGSAGEGMLFRDVADRAAKGILKLPQDATYHIVGLNALTACEKILFSHLKGEGKAKFYWDDAHYFTDDQDHRAGDFVRQNTARYGNALAVGEARVADMPEGQWTIIDTPSDTAQARMLPEILTMAEFTTPGTDLTDTAIILADEKLLMPVLTSLPEAISEVNVTMGYPFRLTPLYSFLKQYLTVIRNARTTDHGTTFRSDDLLSLLRHQYFVMLTGDMGAKAITAIISGNMLRVSEELLDGITPFKGAFIFPSAGSALPVHLKELLEEVEKATYIADNEQTRLSTDREYLRMAIMETVRISNLINAYNTEISSETCIRLIDRIYRRLVVPFSGEPLKGVQVMGMLETRALEFRNVIFLSLNEGIFPGKSYENTFIPYNIRRAFGLPTVNEHDSVYSYYFFRLLRKPEKGWFLYNSTSQGVTSGEMSRYLVQMMYSKGFRPETRSVHITVGRSRTVPESLPRKAEHNQILNDLYVVGGNGEKYLSPSAINSWLNCRMRFYYRYVCRMPEDEKIDREIDQRRFGNILHNVIDTLYRPLIGIADAGHLIGEIASDRQKVRETIVRAAAEEMKWSVESLREGKSLIITEVLERYIIEVLKYDAEVPGLKMLHLEDDFTGLFPVMTSSGQTVIRIGGRADRVDSTGGFTRVVDYKTGSPKSGSFKPEELFDEAKEKRSDAFLQALAYCLLISKDNHAMKVLPAIYWVQQVSSDSFTPYAQVDGLAPESSMKEYGELFSIYNEGMMKTVKNIFSDTEPFTMTPFTQRCQSCPYRKLCRR